jgi:3-mercaptopyruvate sulfurtransferase SseA
VAQVKSIELNDDEEVEFVTVKLTAAEAAFIARVTGRQTGETAEQFMAGGAEASHRLYEAMAGGLFNRWYDGGVEEWVNDNS